MKFSKKRKLIAANIAFFIFLFVAVLLAQFGFKIMLLDCIVPSLIEQSLFTFLTMIIYYLSILADEAKTRIPQDKNESKNEKRKLTKKEKLVVINVATMAFLSCCFAFAKFIVHNPPTHIFVPLALLQCWFTLSSMILYYLSVIAEGFGKKQK